MAGATAWDKRCLWATQSPYTFDDTSKQPAILSRDETPFSSLLKPEFNLLHTLIRIYILNVFKRLSSAKERVTLVSSIKFDPHSIHIRIKTEQLLR